MKHWSERNTASEVKITELRVDGAKQGLALVELSRLLTQREQQVARLREIVQDLIGGDYVFLQLLEE